MTVTSSTNFDINELNQKIEELLVCEDKILKLKEIVPEFNQLVKFIDKYSLG
ncbi:hypothetical protein [Arcobacter ellisii]|uniref:hypothetical protein n=1 Tax=Arcobacter ellisii TaxID=913109 RepID=UPI0013E90AFD|nr:hypothetical protein [Arcobacter ellisii]